jgi:hypothetical protein
MIGRRFHCLTVIGLESRGKNGKLWICECSCGKTSVAKTYDLTHEKKKSCGHLRTEHNLKIRNMMLAKNKWGFSGSVDVSWDVDDALGDLERL